MIFWTIWDAKTEGWSGADLKGLCTEAALNALHRTHPQIYSQEEKIEIDEFAVSRDGFQSSHTIHGSIHAENSDRESPESFLLIWKTCLRINWRKYER